MNNATNNNEIKTMPPINNSFVIINNLQLNNLLDPSYFPLFKELKFLHKSGFLSLFNAWQIVSIVSLDSSSPLKIFN